MDEAYQRDPCPYRILDDCGGAFAMGAIGGGLFSLVKGYRNSPPGTRLNGALSAVKARAPVLGGIMTTLACHLEVASSDAW
jgi:hypothetical protein